MTPERLAELKKMGNDWVGEIPSMQGQWMLELIAEVERLQKLKVMFQFDGRSLMFSDNNNNEALKILVGRVEWIYTKALFSTPQIVFRRDGELFGIRILEVERGAYYGPTGKVNNYPELNETVFEPMDRKQVLTMVVSLEMSDKLTLLNEADQAEWEAICQADNEKRTRLEAQQQQADLERKRRELARLKDELGE